MVIVNADFVGGLLDSLSIISTVEEKGFVPVNLMRVQIN